MDHIKACAGRVRIVCLSIGMFFRLHHPAQCIVLYLLRVTALTECALSSYGLVWVNVGLRKLSANLREPNLPR